MANYSKDERIRMARSGQAMRDGSFPIKNCADASNAVGLVGHASNPAAAKAHTIKRIKALGCPMPDAWK